MKSTKLTLIALLSLLVIGCSSDVDSDLNGNLRRDIQLSRGGEEIVNANNAFAFKIFEILNNEEKNVVISPLSLYQYLSMVANGAEGETRKEIVNVLGMGQLPLSEINEINSNLISDLKIVDKKTIFTLANSLWHTTDGDLLSDYMSVLKDCYASEIYELSSLYSDKARDEINSWCERSTYGAIKDFLETNLESSLKYVSYNAAYFKSEWSVPFELGAKDSFYNSDESISKMSYISGRLTTKYFESDDLMYVEIPYGNRAFVLSIILSKSGAPLSIENLNLDISNSLTRDVSIEIPKFKINYKEQMNGVLAELGIRDAFSSEADFTKASVHNQPLPPVLHAASIEVDEKGTVAAAVSGSEQYYALASKAIRVDHSFVFFIREVSTSAILYIGKVNILSE